MGEGRGCPGGRCSHGLGVEGWRQKRQSSAGLELARNGESNQKASLSSLQNKESGDKTRVSWLSGAAYVMAKPWKRLRNSHVFPSSSPGRICPQTCLVLESRPNICAGRAAPMAGQAVSGEHSDRLGTHRSPGPEGMCPRVLGEPAGVIARLFWSPLKCQGRQGGKWQTLRPFSSRATRSIHPWDYRLVTRISVPGKVKEQIILSNSFAHIHRLLLSEMLWAM